MPNQTFLCKLCGCVVYAPSRDAHRRQKHQICSDCVYPDGERVTLEKDFATAKYHCRRCNYSNAVIRYMRTHISACHALSNPDDEDAASIEEVEDGLGPPPSQLARPSQCPPSQCPPSQCPPSQPPPTQPPPVHSQRRSRSSPPPVAVGTLCDPDDLFAPIPSPSPVSRSPPKSDLPASSPPSSSPLAPRPPSPDPLVTHLSDLSPPDNAEDEAANDDDPAPVVLPDDDTEVTSDFQRWGIVVNLAHNVVICVSCHKVVLASSVFTHLKSHGIFDLHSRDVSEALLPFSLIDTRAAIVPRIPFGASTINAIFGLNIIEDCAFCSVCHRGYGSVDSLKKNHFAVSNCNPARQYHEGPGQTFFTNNCRRVFPVSLPDPEPVDPSTSIFESFLATIICPDPALDPLSEPANDRSLSRFLARERWLDVVRKFPPAYLHYLIDEEPAHPFMKPIREVAHAYFEKVVQLLAYTSPHFKRQMAQYGDGPYGGAFSTVRPGTALQYSRYLARLVVFVLRAQEPTDSIHVVPLSEDQCIAAQRLVEALASQSDADLHGLLHTLLYALVTNTPSDATLDSFVFAISNFQVLTAVTAQGFLRTNDIRRLNAQLIYIIRSVMFTELVSRMQADNLQFYPVYQQLRPFLVAEAHTPFAYCAALSGILGSIESQEDMMPQFQFKDLQRKVILFHDIEFSHASVATVVRGAMAEYDSLLSSKLLCGLSKDDPAFRLPQDISKIFDQPQNHTPGFSFFEDTRNDLSHLQYALLRRLVEPHGSSGPFHYVHNERLVWVADSCLRFLRDAYEAEQRLCTMIHLSYGQPARGEELASMTYRNIPGGSARAVYVLHGMLVLVAGYWKCAEKTGRDKVIVRAPAPEVAQRLLFHLGVIRPAQHILAQLFLPKADADRFKHYLFPGLHKTTTGEDVSAYMRSDMEMHLGAPIGVRDYRQLVSALTRWNRDPSLAAQSAHPYEHQRGHETATFDAHYGFSTDMLGVGNQKAIVTDIVASTHWHNDTGLGPKFVQDEYQLVLASDAAVAPSSASATVSAAAIAGEIQTHLADCLPAALVTVLLPKLEQLLTRFAAVITSDRPPSVFTITPASVVQYQVHSHRLRALRDFLVKRTASFTTPLQAQALEVYLSRKVNMLVCLPTGHGKSLLFFLPAKMYEADRTTVVIVPLHSLHADFARRARGHSIPYHHWQPGQALELSYVPLVLVSPEHARTSAFYDLLSQLNSHGRLLRIVLDEAHMLLTHASFRECFSQLAHVRRLSIPIIFLTATLAPHWESALFAKLAVNQVVAFRLPSVRPEIAIRLLTFARQDERDATLLKNFLDIARARRGLIFCKRVSEVKRIADLLDVPAFYSSLEDDRKTHLLKEFTSGAYRALVSTSTLGEGIDIQGLGFVWHYGLPFEPASYSQQAGRMCRDKSFGSSVVYLLENEQLTVPEPDILGVAVINSWAREDICRRIRLSEFLDGAPTQCTVLSNPNLCDVCERHVNDGPVQPLIGYPAPVLANLDTMEFPTSLDSETLPYDHAEASIPNRLSPLPASLSPSPSSRSDNAQFSLPQFDPPSVPSSQSAVHDAPQPSYAAHSQPAPTAVRSHDLRLPISSTPPDMELYFKPVFVPKGLAVPATSTPTMGRRSREEQALDYSDGSPDVQALPTPVSKRRRVTFRPPSPASPLSDRRRRTSPITDVLHPIVPARFATQPASSSRAIASSSRTPLDSHRRSLPGTEGPDVDGSPTAVGTRVRLDAARAEAKSVEQRTISRAIDAALNLLQSSCSKCYVLGRSYTHRSCTAQFTSARDADWQTFKREMRLPNGYCFTCLRPQSNKEFFGWHVFEAPSDCVFGDIIKPAVYVVWADPGLRSALFAERILNNRPRTVEEYIAACLEMHPTFDMMTYLIIFDWACKRVAT